MVSSIYIGLISGTSMDAIDCALVDFSEGSPVQLDFINTEIPDDLRQKLLALCEDHNAQVPLLGEADVELARELAKAVHRILDINNLKPSQIAAIGSHGQTIRHQPQGNAPFTLQIGDPNILAELTGISTVADFRRRDMAAGGQGAPLVPAFHRRIFSSADHDRVILNIGGMANITILKKLGGITAFDTGPGNVLMDYWIQTHQGHPYDHEGNWARTGSTNSAFLAALLNEPYFAMPAPKSTGRELFNKAWLESKLDGCTDLSENDVQTTLLFLTIESIATAITSELDAGEIIVCGGGARNTYLMETLSSNLTGFSVMPSSGLGIMEDSMEAIAFAWMAHKTMHEKPIDFTEITGSSHPVIAGGVYFTK
jgi:anhydro-N-acetylmuramic acid kinase